MGIRTSSTAAVYINGDLRTLSFCAALENCLRRARDCQSLLLLALQQFEHEGTVEGGNNNDKRYLRTLEELKSFRDAGHPFTEEFFQIFRSVYSQQALVLDNLRMRKKQFDSKLRYVRAWRKVSEIISMATFPLGSLGKWIDSLWKNHEDSPEEEEEEVVLGSMAVCAYVAVKELDTIRVLIDRLDIEIRSLLMKADFAIEEDAVRFAVEEMKKKMGVFMKTVEDLGVQADMCSRDMRRTTNHVNH